MNHSLTPHNNRHHLGSATSRQLACMLLTLLAITLLAAAGCHSDHAKTYPVQGKLLVDGKPAAGAQVIFHPADLKDFDPQGRRPVGRVAPDGSFSLTTYDVDDGAPPGIYRVTIYWAEDLNSLEPSPDRLKDAYSNPQDSLITREVRKQDNELDPIEIETD